MKTKIKLAKTTKDKRKAMKEIDKEFVEITKNYDGFVKQFLFKAFFLGLGRGLNQCSLVLDNHYDNKDFDCDIQELRKKVGIDKPNHINVRLLEDDNA